MVSSGRLEIAVLSYNIDFFRSLNTLTLPVSLVLTSCPLETARRNTLLAWAYYSMGQAVFPSLQQYFSYGFFISYRMTFSASVSTVCLFPLKCSVRWTMFLPQTKEVWPSFSMKYPVGIPFSFGWIPDSIILSNNCFTVMIPPSCGLPCLLWRLYLPAGFQSCRGFGLSSCRYGQSVSQSRLHISDAS